MSNRNWLLSIVFILGIITPFQAQNLRHNITPGSIISLSGFYSYYASQQKGSWLVPTIAYQHNGQRRLAGGRNFLLVQPGIAITASDRVDDAIAGNYRLMLPGYVNPFFSFYSIHNFGKSKLRLFPSFTTGLKWLPYTTATRKNFLSNSLIQYYAGLGVGLKYSRYASFNAEYVRLFHNTTDHTRENFRAAYEGKSFYGGYVDLSVKIERFFIKETVSLYGQIDWRSLGRFYQYDKTIAFGFGAIVHFKPAGSPGGTSGKSPAGSSSGSKRPDTSDDERVNSMKKKHEVFRRNGTLVTTASLVP